MSAQSQIYQLYADKLFAVCLKYSENYQDAEDTLQDSFLVIFDKINQYKNKGSFEGWIKRITINTALQKYRNKAPFDLVKEVPEDKVQDFDFKEEEVQIEFLLNLVQQLPNRYRLVFNLYVLDSYSHKEISELLKISVGTSKSNLSRARLLLKKQLQIHQHKEQKA